MLCYFHCTTRESAVRIHISPPSWTSLLPDHPTPLGHHRAPSWAPHAIEQLPTSIYFTHGKKTLLFNSTKCYHDVFQRFPPLLRKTYSSLNKMLWSHCGGLRRSTRWPWAGRSPWCTEVHGRLGSQSQNNPGPRGHDSCLGKSKSKLQSSDVNYPWLLLFQILNGANLAPGCEAG